MRQPHDINERIYFNRWAETYEHSLLQWLFFDRVHRGVLRRIPPDFTAERVLDIGCGTGRLLRRIQERWPAAELVGIDLAEGMVTQAHKFTTAAGILQAPAEYLPMKNGAVDLVTSTTSFHHWSDQSAGVREVARVLRKGGLFILADLRLAHGHPLLRTQVQSMFEGAGLSIRSQKSPLIFYAFIVGEKISI